MEDGKPKQQEVQNVNVLENNVQPDVEYKDFWRNPEHFADLFNGVCASFYEKGYESNGTIITE